MTYTRNPKGSTSYSSSKHHDAFLKPVLLVEDVGDECAAAVGKLYPFAFYLENSRKGPFLEHSPPLQNACAFSHLYPPPLHGVVGLIAAMSPEARFTRRMVGYYSPSWI
jgi:hypothetical protein